jgi:hypothetical protein
MSTIQTMQMQMMDHTAKVMQLLVTTMTANADNLPSINPNAKPQPKPKT